MRPHLGGRAASYTLPDGAEIDNCQHVTMACCTNLADFYRRVGASQKIRYFDRLAFLDEQGRLSRMGASALPAPLHLGPSFLRFRSLGWRDKAGIARALGQIARRRGQPGDSRGVTMLEWLRRHGQTPAAIERFWRLVLVSALDEELDRAEAQYGIDVFWKGFLANRHGFRLGVPRVPLGELYAGCREAIERGGGEIRTRARAARFRIEAGRVEGLIFDDGTEARADAYVAAVPPVALLGMLREELVEGEPVFAHLRRLRSSPITGIHFWFDRPVTREPFLALVGLQSQWVFNKTALLGGFAGRGGEAGKACPGEGDPQYLQVVISASYDLVPRSRQEIIDMVRGELNQVFPAAGAAQVVKATVVKETAATFSPEPGAGQWRPGPCSPLGKLYLAGDWTNTGWPSTMEGAVRSGYLATQAILTAAGQRRAFLQPDLPPEGFMRIGNPAEREERKVVG